MKFKFLSATVLTLLLSAVAFAQTAFDKSKLDQLFERLAAKDKAMGSLTVARDGKILYSRVVGASEINGKERTAATASTKYRIGSITKTFTAALIFNLADEGKLKLTDTLDKYYPNIPNAKSITLANLLNHRSGIHNFTNDADYPGYLAKSKTKDEMLALIAKSKPDFEPNARAAYSNSNYVLLGYIAEKAAGKPYQTLLKEKITGKIGLNDTYVGGKTNPKNNESRSYTFAGDWQAATETDMSIPGGAGALVSTPADLTRFIAALFDGKLVSEAALNQMKTINETYGSGMFQYPVFDKKGYGHSGGIDGFNSMLVYVPEDKLAVAYISNGTIYPVNDIIIAAFATAYNRPFEVPTFEVVAVKSEDLKLLTGVYAAPNFPLKITVTEDKGTLSAQATGQSAFPLEATAPNRFKFDAARIVLEFDPAKNQMTLKQAGQVIVFTKEK